MLKYKFNLLEALKEKGYSTYRLRKDNIFGESTLQTIRRGEPIGAKTLDVVCELLECQPGDILEWEPNNTSVSI